MESIRADAIGGFNAFLDAQKGLSGEAALTLALFDHDYDLVLDAAPIATVEPLTTETYVPRGTTALLDALGRTIDAVCARLAGTPPAEAPDAVLVCVLTDGLENASSDYTRDRVQALVKARQADGWSFQFLAANVDAFAEAGGLGIARDDSYSFVADASGTAAAFLRVSERATAARRR